MAQRQFKPTSPVGGALFPPVTIGDVGAADTVQYLPSYLLGGPSTLPKENSRKDVLKSSLDPNNNVRGVQQNNLEASAKPPSKTGPSFTSTPVASLDKAGPPKYGLGSAASELTNAPTKSPRSGESGRGHWITVSGFLPANKSQVLRSFSSIGSLVEYIINPGCNWMHLRYSSSTEAKKALAKNGSVLDGTMMITVKKFDGQTGLTGGSGTENSGRCQIRPLANNSMMNQVPVRESGIVSKFTELFGW